MPNNSPAAVTVPAASLTKIADLEFAGHDRVMVEIAVADQDLDGFEIRARFHPAGSELTLFSEAAEYAEPPDGGLLIGCSGDLTTLAAGTSGWFVFECRGIVKISLYASAAVDSAAVTVYATGV